MSDYPNLHIAFAKNYTFTKAAYKDMMHGDNAPTKHEARYWLEVLERLMHTRDTDSCGICYHLDGGLEIWASYYMNYWPEHSGDAQYPVSVNILIDACLQYEAAKDKWSGAYGEKRRELLEWLIDTLAQQINSGKF